MIGQKLQGRYRLDRRLGAGNQGEVYLAYDEDICRTVAIKVLTTPAADATNTSNTLSLALREAIATAQFEHPNVVRVFDFNSKDVPFLVMEYLRGETADQLALPLDSTLLKLLVSQICGALQNAHVQGMVHRDLKPGNLMLVDRGKPEQRFIILDLGLAKLKKHGKMPLDVTYSGAGTPLYMSPEQINAQSVDLRSDIYSFGTMLFEMLTGVSPFASRGASLGSLLKAVCNERPQKLSDALPGGVFSPAMEDLVRDCLEKDPALRPASMSEVNERFQAACLDRSKVFPKPPSRWRRRFLYFAAVAGCLVGIGFNWEIVKPNAQSLVQSILKQWKADSPPSADSLPDHSSERVSLESIPPNSKPSPSPHRNVDSPIDTPPVLQPSIPVPLDLNMISIPDRDLEEEVPFSIDAQISGADAGNVKRFQFSLVSDPKCSARIDQAGHLEWTPSEMEGPGIFHLTVAAQAIDNPAQQVKSTFVINVREVNKSPRLSAIVDQMGGAERELRLSAQAVDPDWPKNLLTYQLGDGAPSGAKINPDTGEFAWTPMPEQAGKTYPIQIVVTDNGQKKLSDEKYFKVTVPKVERKSKVFQNSIGMKFVRIEPGEFLMGAGEGDDYHCPQDPKELDKRKRYSDRERPLHRVQFQKPFSMGIYEVTQAEFKQVTQVNPSGFVGPDTLQFPVEQVTWFEAQEFCQKLQQLAAEKAEGRRYRLPTEAEWEYACRAGTVTPFHCKIEELAEYANFDTHQTVPVGLQRKPNAWGLSDMHGNVWEWCSDNFDSNFYGTSTDLSVAPTGPQQNGNKVIRGGSYAQNVPGEPADLTFYLRSAFRGTCDPHTKENEIGFRVICEQGF